MRSSLRRLALSVLASVLVVSVLATAPVHAAAPGGCDADSDGAASGVVEEVVRDGGDGAADAF